MTVEDRTSKVERGLEVAVIAAALATIPVIVAQELGARGPGIVAIDWAIWGVFVADLVAGIAIGPRPGQVRRLRSHLLSLALVVLTFPLLPTLLQALRLVRLVRLARLPRVVRAVRVLRVLTVEARALRALRAVFLRHGLVYLARVAPRSSSSVPVASWQPSSLRRSGVASGRECGGRL